MVRFAGPMPCRGVTMQRNALIDHGIRGIRGFRMAVAVGVMFAAAGCSMPSSMGVRSGTDPRHSDDDVRFRATLYLRVFQICQNVHDDKDFRPVTYKRNQDSLYRFRMTGKASALGNEVHFESGILRRHEIDGFGQTAQLQKTDKNETGQISTQRNELESGVNEPGKAVADIKNIGIASPGPNGKKGPQDKVQKCPPGYDLEQKFALRGPEGWRVLNQDERLVLAMSSSAKPLVSSLRTLARLRGDPRAATEMPLIEEENRVLDILLKLQSENEIPGESAAQKVMKLLEGGPKDQMNAGTVPVPPKPVGDTVTPDDPAQPEVPE